MWTSATLSVHPTMLEIGVSGVVLVEIDEISSFSSFGVKLVVIDHISGAVMVAEGVDVSEEVTDSVGEEKLAIFDEISAVEFIFEFFSAISGEHQGLQHGYMNGRTRFEVLRHSDLGLSTCSFQRGCINDVGTCLY